MLIPAASNTDRVLVPGQHGWEIGEATTETIAGALQEIFTISAAARAQMGATARAHVLESFTIARVADDFMGRYDALLAPGRLDDGGGRRQVLVCQSGGTAARAARAR